MATGRKQLRKVGRHSHSAAPSENMIIHGDNSDALDLLRDQFHARVKCIYIDPPYNNGERYTHYHDAEEHEDWIHEMTAVLHKLKPFLRDDGSIWISIDDSEMHYLKVAADLVFGRRNFVSTIVWQQRTTRENRRIFSNNHEYILVYARDPKQLKNARHLLPTTPAISSRYKNPDGDPRGPWQSVSANVQAGHAVKSQFYEVVAPNGRRHLPPNGRCWIYNKKRMSIEIKNNSIWFGKDGCGVPRIKKFLSESKIGLTPETLWLGSDVGTTKLAKKQLLDLFPDNPVFDTPKPEQLIKRILDIATDEGDIILDAFLGSGTSAAVAHKMKRKYVGIEVGQHIVGYVVCRLRKIIKGESGGISQDVNWKGGGDFDFYRIV